MALRVRPLLDRVLVRRLGVVNKTSGGILIPESAVKKASEGVVLAVGPGGFSTDGKRLPIDLKVNDKVLLPQYGGNQVKQDDEELFLFRADDILGVIE
eukprot:gnl/Spiro4/7134_TR3718_c0_g1_i1.p1 gnl/Spiro4/7134_TR3718_c0_g1~~gnl/Spiro4/7134_TR3718_c0_g1_i1.p1  ORF type:complete len:113 (-),score=34.10 gnl/Spiro4/7134_TR3718_c0_g1_i1:100-393(-)